MYPFFLVVFWYRDFFPGSVRITTGILVYAANLLSIPLLIKTFFKPLKSEYRQGLVWFSISAGIVVKSILLAITLPILLVLTYIVLFINLLVLVLPIVIIGNLIP